MIKPLEWDSDFFKYPVGMLRLTKDTELDIKKILMQENRFRLVYVIADDEIPDLTFIKLVDKKVSYLKEVSTSKGFKEVVDYNPQIHSYDQLLRLAYQSGIYSRFKKDKNFSDNEFELLYEEWLQKSITKELAFKVLVKETDKELAGFITLGRKDNETAEIGLIAVDDKFRRRNIGTELIKKSEAISLEMGFQYLSVATQYENSSARKLYEKNNFVLNNILHIYHYWNL